jgi:adenylate kinase
MSIVITGNPGVGKHTVTKKISQVTDCEIVDINKIALDAGIYEKKDETLDVDVTKLKKILKNKITEKSLIVGHLAPYVLTKSQVSIVIILRKSPYKLLSVYKKRKYSSKKIKENLESEILGIIAHDAIKKFGKTKTHQLDTTSDSISKTTKKILNIFDGRIEDSKIDWLTLISKNNDLRKFFSY